MIQDLYWWNEMIQTKKDLKEYLKSDQYALRQEGRRSPRFGRDEIWRFEILLRKAEYYTNNRKNPINRILYVIYKTRFHRMSVKLGFSIPLNVFGKGLSIAHYGPIVVNSNAKIGDYCRIQECVTIGSTGGNDRAPQIGDFVFIACGARLIGDIRIGNNVAIGANAVVTKSCEKNHVTLAGIPAKVISNHGSDAFISVKNTCKE